MEIAVIINGRPFKVNSSTVPVDTSLNTFLRTNAQLTGTKFMCLEGGCGVCIVTLRGEHPVTKQLRTWAVNSCLAPVFACHGLEVITIEGVGSRRKGYHPIQKALFDHSGTQCGYCSPGMVMNMYSLLENKDQVSAIDIENSFGGNICRCTGYRPILDAFKSLAKQCDEEPVDDIEDLGRVCQRTGELCVGKCLIGQSPLVLSFDDDIQWYKVTTVQQVFDIFDKIGTKPYMLVAGNTAHGVYRRSTDLKVFVDVNGVEELRSHGASDGALRIGANVNLTETMDILLEYSKNAGFEYCSQLHKHIDLIANVPVRNAGTIAGNLSIKRAHPEFPSDMFLILETVGAMLTVRRSDGNAVQLSITDFLSSDMSKKVIISVVLNSLNKSAYRFRTYKIMPRAQNAHAYVNAGIMLHISNDMVTSARICFGGISPKFVHAINTEQFLIGKNPYSNDTLLATLKVLADELKPDWNMPDADPLYRKNLALSLFYKFIISTCDEQIGITSRFVSGGDIIERPLSSGTQTFDTYKEKYPMTQPVTKLEGQIQCAGELLYSNDIPPLKDELWAAFVLTGRPHRKIGQIDATEALKIPGVFAFYSAKDIPGKNDFAPPLLLMGAPEELFVGIDSSIKFFGQPAGIVLAESLSLANIAAKLVKITYVEEFEDTSAIMSMARTVFGQFVGTGLKQVIPTIRDAVLMGATERFQDAGKQMKASQFGVNTTKSINGQFEVGSQFHFTMEPQTTVCIPTEDVLDVYSSTQWGDFINVGIARCLGIPENRINLIMRRVGGAYGAKITRAGQVACACALGSHLSGRPVRFVLTIESNMTTVGKRYALVSDYEVDIDDAGKIQRLHNNFAEDFGCSTNEPVPFFTTDAMTNCYANEAWTVKSQIALTDAPSHTFCRAPGTCEGIAMIENIMEHIAFTTGRSPIDVRLANCTTDSEMHSLIPVFLTDVEFPARKKSVDEFNTANRWRKRGIAVVPMRYPLHYFAKYSVFIAIYHADGTVAVTHSGCECGQGINTKVTQVVARELGIPLADVTVKTPTNNIFANSFPTGGSVASDMVAYACKKACEHLLDRIKPVRDSMPANTTWSQITTECNNKLIDLTEKYVCTVADFKSYVIHGLSCAEIEVDILTGSVMLRRVDILEDTGESMSPLVDVGQVEGAFVMGLGYWLTENLAYDRQTGELLTNRTWTYKPPGAKDIPVDFRVRFMANKPNELFALRSKATGEPALCLSVVAIMALRNALDSARKDAGLNEWYNLGSACTPDVIFSLTGNDPSKYLLKE